MKRILLIKPPFNGLTYPGSPKGPELLESAVRAMSTETGVHILDLQLAGHRNEDVMAKLEDALADFRPHLVGITNLSAQANTANALARAVKRADPKIIVVKGGYHESAAADWTMRLHRDSVDFCIGSDGSATTRVEGEEAFVMIARLLESGGREALLENLPSVPGAVYLDKDAIRMNPAAVAPKELLDGVSVVAPIHAPEYDFPVFGRLPTAHAELSRGCLMRCNYCSAAKASGVRMRSEGSIRSQLELLKARGFKAFYADDANLASDKYWARMVSKALHDNDFMWGANARVDFLDRKTVLDFGRNGCRYLFTGLESAVTEVLLGMNKVASMRLAERYLAQAVDVYGWLSEAGIPSAVFLVFGSVRKHGQEYVPETMEDIKESIRFAIRLKDVSYLSMNYLRFLPGTRFSEDPAFSCIRPTGKRPIHGGYWDDLYYGITGEKDVRFDWMKHPEIYSCFELEDCMPVSTLADHLQMEEIVRFALSEIRDENRRRKSGGPRLQLVSGETGKELIEKLSKEK